MSSLAMALAGALMDKERQQKFHADYAHGMNLGVNAAPPAPLPPDAMPLTTPDAYSKFPVSTPVRDILSGMEGTVSEPPKGEFGDVVFIKCNADGKTYAVRFDQVQAIEQAPGAGILPPPPVEVLPPPGAEGEAPPEVVPAIEPAALKAKKTTADGYREYVRARAELNRMAASIKDESLVVAATDDRRLTFKQLKAHLTAITEPKAKDALTFIGYVPANFDAIWAALARDGVKMSVVNAMFDIKEMVAKGLTAEEITMTVCASNGGVRGKVLNAIKIVRAYTPPINKPVTPAEPGMAYVWNAEKAVWEKVKASQTLRSCFRWNAEQAKAVFIDAEGKESIDGPVSVPGYDVKSPASGAPKYSTEKYKDEGKTGGGDDTAGKPVQVSTTDKKAPASGAPAYPTLDPEKAGGMKAGAEVDSIGQPLKVKTYDEQSKASGKPKYPVAGPGTGGAAPRDQTVDTLGDPLKVKTEDIQSPASGAPAYPVLDPNNAGGQAAPGTPGAPGAVAPAAPAPVLEKPSMTPNAVPPPVPPKAEPKPEAAAPAPAPKKDEPKPEAKAEPKKDEPKPEAKKDESKAEPKKDEKPEAKKDEPKAEPKKEEKSEAKKDEKPKDEEKK